MMLAKPTDNHTTKDRARPVPWFDDTQDSFYRPSTLTRTLNNTGTPDTAFPRYRQRTDCVRAGTCQPVGQPAFRVDPIAQE